MTRHGPQFGDWLPIESIVHHQFSANRCESVISFQNDMVACKFHP